MLQRTAGVLLPIVTTVLRAATRSTFFVSRQRLKCQILVFVPVLAGKSHRIGAREQMRKRSPSPGRGGPFSFVVAQQVFAERHQHELRQSQPSEARVLEASMGPLPRICAGKIKRPPTYLPNLPTYLHNEASTVYTCAVLLVLGRHLKVRGPLRIIQALNVRQVHLSTVLFHLSIPKQGGL